MTPTIAVITFQRPMVMIMPGRERVPRQLKAKDVPELRQRLLKKQGGICPICEKTADAPCLDHHHVKRIKGSGQIRGVLCRSCNVLIAKMENNCVRYGVGAENLPRVLRNMALYLERPQLPYIHPSEKEKARKITKTSYNRLKKLFVSNGGEGSRFPEYPKSGKLTVKLSEKFIEFNIEPEFYK